MACQIALRSNPHGKSFQSNQRGPPRKTTIYFHGKPDVQDQEAKGKTPIVPGETVTKDLGVRRSQVAFFKLGERETKGFFCGLIVVPVIFTLLSEPGLALKCKIGVQLSVMVQRAAPFGQVVSKDV